MGEALTPVDCFPSLRAPAPRPG